MESIEMVSDIRKRLLRSLKDSVVRTRKGNALDTVVYHLVSDAYDVAGWDQPHRLEQIGKLQGAIEMSKIASATDEPVLGVYREVLVEALDILQTETNGCLLISERRVPRLVEALSKYKVS